MIKQIIAAIAGLAIATPAMATSWTDVNQMVELVKGTGTTVSAIDCDADGVMGYYSFQPEKDIDALIICKDNVPMYDADAVWEVVVHEATHVMQACFAGPILKDSYIPRVLRELQETAPHYYKTLQQYRGDHKRVEIEAFWMELRTPAVAMEFMTKYCYKPEA